MKHSFWYVGIQMYVLSYQIHRSWSSYKIKNDMLMFTTVIELYSVPWYCIAIEQREGFEDQCCGQALAKFKDDEWIQYLRKNIFASVSPKVSRYYRNPGIKTNHQGTQHLSFSCQAKEGSLYHNMPPPVCVLSTLPRLSLSISHFPMPCVTSPQHKSLWLESDKLFFFACAPCVVVTMPIV